MDIGDANNMYKPGTTKERITVEIGCQWTHIEC